MIPFPRNYIEKTLEAGKLAPTAHKNQPQKISTVTSSEGLALIGMHEGFYY